eukprot:maker-scaffold2160_size19641-snap-gene-0.3 protein:Tk00436 transcript:maker-scaffold2160_size19641-snap-gene-0.3-mRNA-1 annotation:"hypothetical protein"
MGMGSVAAVGLCASLDVSILVATEISVPRKGATMQGHGWIGLIWLVKVTVGENLCFDSLCFSANPSIVDLPGLQRCACTFNLVGVEQMDTISAFDPERCQATFTSQNGAQSVLVDVKGPGNVVPKIVNETKYSQSYSSIHVWNPDCNSGSPGNSWTPIARHDAKTNASFVWDLDGLFKISRIEFQNGNNPPHYDRAVKEFTVAISQTYDADNPTWIEVLHEKDLPFPPKNCDPIRQYELETPYLARFVKFESMEGHKLGPMVIKFRVW